MTTVVRRTFASSPVRDAHETWIAIVDLLTKSASAGVRNELTAVAGAAASIISDQAPMTAPIIVTCDGPRTRIYCVYDDDAIDGSSATEDNFQFDPLKGEWAISLPCPVDDLVWVRASLARHSHRITARDLTEGLVKEAATVGHENGLVLDPAKFLGV